MTRYYKIAMPSGFDFFTGKTINYRAAIGAAPVRAPAARGTNPELCTPSVLHASEVAEQCFVGGKVPCSLYVVEGRSVVSDSQKHGFLQLRVIEELDPAQHFKWNYAEAANPVHPFRRTPPDLNNSHIELLRSWASVTASVRASVRASVWASVTASVRASVRANVTASSWASVSASVFDSVFDSVSDSVSAYIGSIFAPVVDDWRYVTHKPGTFPFQPAVNLWKQGIVPSCDGKLWRLHGHEDARILWEGKL